MPDLLKNFTKNEMGNEIKKKYPHLKYPSCMYAQIVQCIHNGNKHVCTIKILDKNQNPDYNFPEIPSVETEMEFKIEDIVVIVLLYGECNPYIIGRC